MVFQVLVKVARPRKDVHIEAVAFTLPFTSQDNTLTHIFFFSGHFSKLLFIEVADGPVILKMLFTKLVLHDYIISNCYFLLHLKLRKVKVRFPMGNFKS